MQESGSQGLELPKPGIEGCLSVWLVFHQDREYEMYSIDNKLS